MRKIKIEIIILVILWITTIYSLINYEIGLNFKTGIVGLIISTSCIKIFPRFSSYFLMLLLLLSIVELITFSSTNFYILMFGVNFNILYSLFFAILIYKRRRMINEWISSDSTETVEHVNNRVLLFKKEFKNLPDKELENKRNNNVLVDDAKQAINELLKERKNH